MSFQLLFDKQSDTDKKDQSFPPWNGKSSHCFAPGRKICTSYHNLEVLCFARWHFVLITKKAPEYSKAWGKKKKKKGLVPGSEEVFHCCSFNVGLFFFSAYLVGLWISEHMGFSNLSWCNSWSQNYFLIQMETRKSYKGLLKSSFCISTRHKTTCSLVAKPQLITIITR